MSKDITLHPDKYTFTLGGGVTMGVTLDGGTGKAVVIDAGLDDIGVTLVGDPKQPVTFDLGLDKICVSLALTQIPRVRVHIPSRYDFGFCLFGMPIFNFRFAGETMLLTEDNPQRIFYKPAAEVGRDQYTVNTREES